MPKQATKTEPESSVDEDHKDHVHAAVADGLVRFEFRGKEFTVPASGDDWDADAWIALLRDQYYQVAEYQLSATGQWAALKRLAPTRKDVNEFLLVFSTVIREGVDFS
ncbi:hypothetical protein H7J71_25215 [Mycolicibacterium peregrinum]|uniref:hypothetical protein n=1 Tax=Mycolicibacterium peregrinum TaxID=43304 RepID=UPI0006D786EF|nr:hypothetical protein [Mycolicibacterium peregrinum]MCV7205309.1 hypothetical protein [Mycolicibacterium peregrinum]ORW54795.1 hypothetical protein AWC21_23925 [Mycolicibacterium peregrinum]